MKIRFAFAASFGLSMALFFAPVQGAGAASLTFSDPSCADFSLTDQGNGNFQVTCNFIAVPICQLTSSTLNPSVGSTITLNAACTSKAFGWLYTGTATQCSTVQPTCTDTQTTAGPVTYTVIGGNAAGRGPVATLTVNWQASATTAPSGCSLQASPSSLPAGGGSTTLSVSCSGGGAPTAFAWTGGSVTPTTSVASQSTNLTSTTGFSVTPSNSAGNGNTASTTVSVAGTSSSLDFCSQYSGVTIIDVPWGAQAITGGAGGGFQAKGIVVARFTVPAGFGSSSGSKGTVTAAEYGDPGTYRQASLSTKACDFRGVSTGVGVNYMYSVGGGGVSYPLMWSASNQPSVQFTVTGGALATPQLAPGTTYYFNIRNYSPYLGGVSCAGSTCNAVITVSTPR